MSFSFSHITDIHLGSYSGGTESGGLNSRFVDFVKTFNQSIDFSINNNVDFCLITGDIFRHKDPQPVEFDAFAAGVKRLFDNEIPTYIVLGNHDIFLSHQLKNSISALKTLGLKDVHISEEPELIYLNAGGKKICIQTMPYQSMTLLNMKSHELVSEYMVEKINSMYAEIKQVDHIIFAGHFSIQDSVTGAEQQTINRFNEPIVPKSVFKDKDYIYGAMGHLHRYQTVMKKPLIIYGGSINRTDFNEWKEDKGFVYCTQDKSFEHEFIKVDAQRFLDLEYSLESEENPEEYVMNDLLRLETQLKNAVVRLQVNISEANQFKYDAGKISEYLNQHCSWIHGSALPHVKKTELIENGEYNEYMNSVDVIKKYCDSSSKITNKSLFMELAEEIIKETNNKK